MLHLPSVGERVPKIFELSVANLGVVFDWSQFIMYALSLVSNFNVETVVLRVITVAAVSTTVSISSYSRP